MSLLAGSVVNLQIKTLVIKKSDYGCQVTILNRSEVLAIMSEYDMFAA